MIDNDFFAVYLKTERLNRRRSYYIGRYYENFSTIFRTFFCKIREKKIIITAYTAAAAPADFKKFTTI